MYKDSTNHITSLLVLLLGVSLSFSTVHFHDYLGAPGKNNDMEPAHHIESDISLCPVCGYLLKADFSDAGSFQGYFTPVEARLGLAQNQWDDPFILFSNSRSPPPLV